MCKYPNFDYKGQMVAELQKDKVNMFYRKLVGFHQEPFMGISTMPMFTMENTPN